MGRITVFTPTYNRANTITRTYESLCRQTCKDFKWIVVDDGSTDNTRELVEQWKSRSDFPIKYFYKENGGLHTGYNTAIENIDTELFVCVDSDDFMPNDAVEIIIKTWNNVRNKNLAGIIGLDFEIGTNRPIGGYFPSDNIKGHFLDFETKIKHSGDTKMVLRTDVVKPHIPMPTFTGEKNFNPIYLFLEVDPKLEYILINRNLCYVDYQPGGMSANIFRQFRNSPRSFGLLRHVRISHPRIPLKRKLIDYAHLISSAIFAKDWKLVNVKKYNWLFPAALPIGVAINMLVRIKTHK